MEPRFTLALTLIGDSYAKAGQMDSALAVFKRVIDYNFIDYDAHWFLGDAYAQSGEPAQAVRELTIAHVLNVNNPVIKKMLILHRLALERQWDEWDFTPQYELSDSGGAVKITATKDWLGYAIVKAAWKYEPGYAESVDGEKHENNVINWSEEKESVMATFADSARGVRPCRGICREVSLRPANAAAVFKFPRHLKTKIRKERVMKNSIVPWLICMIVCSSGALALPNQALPPQDPAQAREKAIKALRSEEEGNYNEAIKLLEDAQQLDRDNITYPYELGYAYYATRNYKKAVDYLEAIADHKDVFDQVFQLLGNSYDEMGDSKKALAVYDEGLKKFPQSGKLLLEKGNLYYNKKETVEAIKNYELGIAAEPQLPSNYYNAARIFCLETEERVWGMIYGEIFMNLERNTERTADISKILYETYKRGIKTTDSSTTISFSKNMTMNIGASGDLRNMKLPFGMAYEMTTGVALGTEKVIALHTLDRIRTRFVDTYYQRSYDKIYPNILFEYHRRLKEAGHFEAYNHWILMKGDEDGFTEWQSANRDKWEKFVQWFGKNPLVLDGDHRFYRAQY